MNPGFADVWCETSKPEYPKYYYSVKHVDVLFLSKWVVLGRNVYQTLGQQLKVSHC